jgi:hypothetical protein
MLSKGPAGFLGIAFVLYLIYLPTSNIVWNILANYQCGCCKIPRIFFEEPNVDEDIGTFSEVLKKSDRVYSIAEELNGRMYGIVRILPNAFEELTSPR